MSNRPSMFDLKMPTRPIGKLAPAGITRETLLADASDESYRRVVSEAWQKLRGGRLRC
jgi:hypothetical protein